MLKQGVFKIGNLIIMNHFLKSIIWIRIYLHMIYDGMPDENINFDYDLRMNLLRKSEIEITINGAILL